MKIIQNINQPRAIRNINFEGYKPVKSKYGDKEYEFNYVFDSDKYDCYVEIFTLGKDSNGNYYTTGICQRDDFYKTDPNDNEPGLKLESGKATRVDLATEFGIAPDEPFAYHYKFYPKGQRDNASWRVEAGNIINETANGHAWDIYNVVPERSSTVSKGGAMKLIFPDINNVSWVYDDKNKIVKNKDINKLRQVSKNFVNKMGGSIAGIEKDIEDGKLDNFTRIITTPLFADDSLSSHGYWNKNCMQMAQSLGNINNYASLQRKMFAKGINLVADGAYVNEGLEGIHFQNVLKYGADSPYVDWFKFSDLSAGPLNLGVFGKKDRYITHRLINSKYNFDEKPNGIVKISRNKKYNSKAPTYIQIYDSRIKHAENMTSEELIKAYNKLNRDHIRINNHNDTVIPYSFRINIETYKKNVEKLNELNEKLNVNYRTEYLSGPATRMLTQFEYFGLGGKHEGGFETWDANPDIAKLNFVFSHSDNQKLKNIADPTKRSEAAKHLRQNNMQVQDYAVTSAKYWTRKTNDILNTYVAQNLRNIDTNSPKEVYEKIKSLENGKVFPKDMDVTEEIVRNVMNDSYFLKGNQSEESYNDIVLRGIMDFPLDSVEFGDDIAATFASPYMTKRAIKEDQIGVPRFDMYKAGNKHVLPKFKTAYDATDKLYTQDLTKFTQEVLDILDVRLKKENMESLKDKNDQPTDFAKYVLPRITQDIAKYAIVKSLTPDTKFFFDKETGEISYDYKTLKDTTLLGLGIVSASPENDALNLIKKIRSGLKRIGRGDKEYLASALYRSIEGTNTNSFKLAEMIVDRTQAGLDWRIDATKDIGDMTSLRNGKTDFEDTWNDVIKFWSKFTDAVKEYHPDVYIAAEVTDEGEIYDQGYGSKSGSRYSNRTEAVRKLLNETGFTTTANYSYFSSDITKIFGKLFDFDGENSPEKGIDQGETILEKLVGADNFLNSGSLESLLYTYTFAGNHDKARALDGYAMDMDMVYTDLTDKNNEQYRERAFRILEGVGYGTKTDEQKLKNYDFDRVSNLAIAKSESIASGLGNACNQVGFSKEKKDYVYEKMIQALANLSNGIHKGRLFEADGFGSKDYNTALEVVLNEMEYLEEDKNKVLSGKERRKLKNKAMENIIDPAMSKLLGQTKFLVALLGNPTLYAGDEYGSTGFETKTKNIYQQNRNIIHEEWVDPKNPEYKEFVKRFKDHIDYQYSLRTRKELQPLNDGTPFALKEQNAKIIDGGNIKISALLRQSPNGAMTISLFNTAGLNHKYNEYYSPKEIELTSIDLSEDRNGKVGIAGGLKPGTKFVNANDKNDVYYVNGHNQITGPDHKPIKVNDTTMILYHEPSFTGRKTLYNPQYHFVSAPYSQTNEKKAEIGKKLVITSK